MTDLAISDALASALADVLEGMFFFEALGETAEPAADADMVAVHLTFAGDPPGCFRMRIAPPAAHTIAADFLGEDCASLTHQQSTDVTLELANMICGAVLSRLESQAAFRLDAPQIVADGTGQHDPAEETRYTVETGSGTLTVAIHLAARTCSSTERYAS